MASTFGELSKQLRQAAADLPSKANQVKKNVISTVNFDLLQTTPVDTGQAVSNWQLNLDGPAEGIREPFAPTRKGYSKQTAGARKWTHRDDPEITRQANIQPALEAAKQVIDAAEPGQSIHVTNNVPYIQALDEGHSAQAQNFVTRAILLGRDLTSRAKLL